MADGSSADEAIYDVEKLSFYAIIRLGPYPRSDLSIAHKWRAGKQFSYNFSHVVSLASHTLSFEWVLVTH